ncbi:MAG: glycine cleavage system aminomethyltransferase GcvT [Candidatus Glassbacteria bacterium]
MDVRVEGELKKTPLYDLHIEYGGKMVPFAGYSMPVSYSGIIEEHLAVRERAGLFDVSHMGRIEVLGDGAVDYLDYLTVNHVARLKVGQAQYSAMLNKDGGIIDDIIVYRCRDRYLVVVNAANHEKDMNWMQKHLMGGVSLRDVTDEIAQLALQGPMSQEILSRLTQMTLDTLRYYWFDWGQVAGVRCLVARTGYTGEDGFEIYAPEKDAGTIWRELIKAGSDVEILPCGLGCRDTLRLEMRYCLYGNDIDEETSPLEAGLRWITKIDKGEFIGREALVEQIKTGVKKRLVGFEMEERGIPRNGYPVFCDGKEVSRVASGTSSPSLKKGIGTAYLPVEHGGVGTRIEIEVRNRRLAAVVVNGPFYKNASHR